MVILITSKEFTIYNGTVFSWCLPCDRNMVSSTAFFVKRFYIINITSFKLYRFGLLGRFSIPFIGLSPAVKVGNGPLVFWICIFTEIKLTLVIRGYPKLVSSCFSWDKVTAYALSVFVAPLMRCFKFV